VVDDADPDLPVPGTGYSFGRLVRAQADGDYGALAAKGRSLLRVDLDGDPVGGLAALEEAADF
jgi:transaldolase/glucose-6-phosphate isomerase